MGASEPSGRLRRVRATAYSAGFAKRASTCEGGDRVRLRRRNRIRAGTTRRRSRRSPTAAPMRARCISTRPVSAGFRRLSIIDLSAAANQPMFAADGATWLVFNGEIYGYRAAARRTRAARPAFRTDSDTEVVLNAYLEWGDVSSRRSTECLRSRSGTRGERTLKLYRDRAGIKPLYYFHDGREFAFASELKAIEIACASEKLAVGRHGALRFPGLSLRARTENALPATASNCRRRTGSRSIPRPAPLRGPQRYLVDPAAGVAACAQLSRTAARSCAR